MSSPKNRVFTNGQTILFMVVLSFVSALILSLMASALKEPQEAARELDRSKEMLKAAKILDQDGYFQVVDDKGEYSLGKFVSGEGLKLSSDRMLPTKEEILEVYNKMIIPLVVASDGKVATFEEAKLNLKTYLESHKKEGYSHLSWKLIYQILNEKKETTGWIIPVNGFGLWDAIYGYLAIRPDGNTVIGISWYDQKETPGLGSNIADWSWQKQFAGKKIFQPGPDGETDFKTASLGVDVIRGKVNEVFAGQPRAVHAVDGMAGATLTGNGVTDAYNKVLSNYRAFLIKLHEESKGG